MGKVKVAKIGKTSKRQKIAAKAPAKKAAPAKAKAKVTKKRK